MKIYNSITEYIPDAKINDKVIFGGCGIMDGVKNMQTKYDTYRITYINPDSISFKMYRGKHSLTTNLHEQKIAVLTKEEFNKLSE